MAWRGISGVQLPFGQHIVTSYVHRLLPVAPNQKYLGYSVLSRFPLHDTERLLIGRWIQLFHQR